MAEKEVEDEPVETKFHPLQEEKQPRVLKSLQQPYTGINPFLGTTPVGCYEAFKIILISLTCIPLIRLLLSGVIFLLMYLFAVFASCCKRDHKEPHGAFRRFFTYPIRFLVRTLLFVWGFYYIPVTRPACCSNEKARVIVANHISLVDALQIFVQEGCCAAAKHDVFKAPILGRILYALQFIPIDRRTTEARKKAKAEIERRIKDERFPPLLIFPQGTTSNYKVITKFQAGAFASGVAVQPVALRFPHCFFDHSLLGSNAFILWRMLCQIINFETLTYLPVYKPTEEEQKNPIVYANNVRKVLAEELKADTTNHSWDDLRLYMDAKKLHTLADTRMFVMDDFYQLAGLGYEQIKKALDRFQTLDKNQDGYLDFEEFASYKTFEKFPNDLKKRLFGLIDHDGDGLIDFRGFLLGVAGATGTTPADDAIELAFEVYDEDKDGKVTKEEMIETLNTLSHKGHEEKQKLLITELADKVFSEKVFSESGESVSKSLTKETFALAVRSHPELISLAFALDYLQKEIA